MAAPARRFVGLGLGILVLGLGGGAGAVLAARARDRARTLESIERARLANHDLGTRFRAATQLVREGEWEAASKKLRELQELNPDYERARVELLLAAAEKEVSNLQRLREALEAARRGELDSAAGALAMVSADTLLHRQRGEVEKELDRVAAQRIASARAVMFQGAGELPRLQEVEGALEEVLRARPEHADARLVLGQVKDAIAHLTHTLHDRRQPPRPPPDEVSERFAAGDRVGAAALARVCAAKHPRCKQQLKDLREFERLYAKVESAPDSVLPRLRELDAKLGTGRPSPAMQSHNKPAADALCLRAKKMSSVGSWAVAVDSARQLQALDPDHGCARLILEEGRRVAKERYLYCFSGAHEVADAIRCYKDVVAMTPRDDEYHLKAKKKLAELAR